jgi:phospholipase D1/2
VSGDDARAEPVAPILLRTALVLVGLGVAITIAGHSVDARRWLTAEGLRDAVGADEWYGPLAYVASIVVGMFLPIPKIVLLGLGGVLFGSLWGFVWAWLGQVLGMTALFVVGRTSLRALARRLVHEHSGFVRRLEVRLEHQGIQAVAALRLFYFMGTPLTIMLSTTRLRLRDFMMGTGIGVVPAVALAVLSADAVASGPTAIEAALIGAAMVLVFGLGTLVRRRVGI